MLFAREKYISPIMRCQSAVSTSKIVCDIHRGLNIHEQRSLGKTCKYKSSYLMNNIVRLRQLMPLFDKYTYRKKKEDAKSPRMNTKHKHGLVPRHPFSPTQIANSHRLSFTSYPKPPFTTSLIPVSPIPVSPSHPVGSIS